MTDQTSVLLLVEDNPDDAAFFDHSFKKTGLAELDLAACYRMGVNSYVVKSMDFDQFNLSVRQICEYWLGLNQTPHS